MNGRTDENDQPTSDTAHTAGARHGATGQAPLPASYPATSRQPTEVAVHAGYARPAPRPPAPNAPAIYGAGPVGKVRGSGGVLLLTIVTLGLYPLYWFYAVHAEMRRHKGTGIGGGIAVLLAFFIVLVMPFITSEEVGQLYVRRGHAAPVGGATGFWYFPGSLILVGPLVWFLKTNGALNGYWRSQGAR